MPLQRLLAAFPHLPLLSALCLTLLVLLLCLPPLHGSARALLRPPCRARHGAGSAPSRRCRGSGVEVGLASAPARRRSCFRGERDGLGQLLRGRSAGDYLVRQGRRKSRVSFALLFTLKRDIIFLFSQPFINSLTYYLETKTPEKTAQARRLRARRQAGPRARRSPSTWATPSRTWSARRGPWR